MKAQRYRLLDLLKSRGNRGVFIWEINTPRPLGGLGIAGYTERITELRQEGYQVVNVKKGLYMLANEQHEDVKSPEIWRIEQKLESLRDKYRNAENDTDKSLIKVQGLALQRSLEKLKAKAAQREEDRRLYQEAQETFFK